MIRSGTNTVLAWAHADSGAVTERFWNMILRDAALTVDLYALVKLFAIPVPAGRTKYNHHNGMQP